MMGRYGNISSSPLSLAGVWSISCARGANSLYFFARLTFFFPRLDAVVVFFPFPVVLLFSASITLLALCVFLASVCSVIIPLHSTLFFL